MWSLKSGRAWQRLSPLTELSLTICPCEWTWPRVGRTKEVAGEEDVAEEAEAGEVLMIGEAVEVLTIGEEVVEDSRTEEVTETTGVEAEVDMEEEAAEALEGVEDTEIEEARRTTTTSV